MDNNSTICAIATGRGGAIGIIRISGGEAINITDKIFVPASTKGLSLSQRKANTVIYGTVVNNRGDTIDEVLVSVFRAPHSYTGEDSVEISCHGSSYILQQVMDMLIENGCRAAGPGEFTQRAFVNGKMDLSQAEAVADLIASSSAATHRLAINQMRGGFSRELSLLRDKLLHLTSLMELELDFSDHEELEFADRSELYNIAVRIRDIISHLASSFKYGNALKNGVPVAIVGETNVGKSTLLNALLNEDKAIVSDIHGTTRDVIEDTTDIGGTTFRFIDTAGIRETTDAIEQLGIERTYKKIRQADIVLWIIDVTDARENIERLAGDMAAWCEDKALIIVCNKIDKVAGQDGAACQDIVPSASHVYISAKSGDNISELKRLILSAAGRAGFSADDVVVTNARHYEALIKSLDAIGRVCDSLQTNLSADFISQDLRECLYHLAGITGGEITTEETLQNIFKNFCIGK